MLSKKEIEEIRPSIEKLSIRVLGSVEATLVTLIERGLYNGYDKQKYLDKFGDLRIDSKKASKLSEKLEVIIEDFRDSQKGRKRSYEDDSYKDSKKSKIQKHPSDSKNGKEEIKQEEPTPLSSNQIRQMMQNAQRQIEEKKRQLESINASKITKNIEELSSGNDKQELTTDDRARRIAELQKQIQAKLSGSALTPQMVVLPFKNQDKPRPLILDDEGRTVDTSGREINIQTLTPTLKANIRAKKRETFKHQQQEKSIEEAKLAEPSFFDDRIMIKPAVRTKRSLRFHEPGKFQQMGERLR